MRPARLRPAEAPPELPQLEAWQPSSELELALRLAACWRLEPLPRVLAALRRLGPAVGWALQPRQARQAREPAR